MSDTTTQLAVAGVAGLLLGSLFTFLSPVAISMLVGAVVAVLLTIWRPEVAVLGILVLLSTLLPEGVPRINIGVGGLYPSDFILIALLFLVVLRWIAERKPGRSCRSPLDLPILLFVAWSIITAVRGLLEFHNEYPHFISEVRTVVYYLMFFAITRVITRERNLDAFLKWFFLLATVVAVALASQYVMGIAGPFAYGRVETLTTAGRVYGGVTRITDIVGEGLLTIAFIVKTITLFTSGFRLARIADIVQWGLLGIGLTMTFNRTHWAAAVLAFVLAFLLTRRIDRRRLFRWSLVSLYLVPTLLILVILLSPGRGVSRFVTSSLDRLASFVSEDTYESESTSTILWRRFEDPYAFADISSQPVLGLGLGAKYRPALTNIDFPPAALVRFIHNGHLWIAMKTGLVGYLLWAWFSVLAIWRGIRNWRRVPDAKMRSLLLGFTLAYVGIVIGAVFHPFMMVLYWVPVLATVVGVNEIIIRDYVQARQGRRVVTGPAVAAHPMGDCR
jgi:O-antigen ligase